MRKRTNDKIRRAQNAVIKLFLIFGIGCVLIFKLTDGIIAFLSFLLWTAVVVAVAAIKDHLEDLREENHRLAKELYKAQKPWWEERNKLLFGDQTTTKEENTNA